MDAREGLAERFEAQRGQLRAVAHRMLGSVDEADDAVQEAWLRLGRVDAGELDNLAGWLRTVVTRICLDMLRSRRSRREDLAEQQVLDHALAPLSNANTTHGDGSTPEDEALLADSVSRALLVVLDTLAPAERIAFVLHDMFAVPFEEIAPVVGRTQGATKKLASRARLKVQGSPVVPAAELARHRRVVSAFLAAARAGDLTAILAVLAPDVVRRADPSALPPGGAAEVRGARAVAEGTAALAHRSRLAEPALVNGTVGAVVAPRGRLLFALTFTIESDRITEYEVIADPARLRRLDLAVLDRPGT
ncbi:sigma-70 family RNA polymerase sigma factor [Streptomyces sp. NBC_01267]|uniref:sigma-70 family RNA polymerase sigma factor n=1 Tax=unclassified Streptomyces TaxID=2593676 RepID=UPI0020253AD7|nr:MULTISPECIES: sigma-70 family RNA polymerase sigma factor [unclassified Streptomyces]WSC22365.1 sigma-70 family RNA polymerase sigma factor [Streptomyces sp. NBC_01766]WSV56208.1 sigma-70 family RNA polymerase sigma factor [Streptomyces sp. NBC_01014]